MSLAGSPQPAGQAGGFHRVTFTGKASEYFGIWIVNVLLTILTIGIYSAWAKVRRNRYFFGNTVLLGRSFEYHAKGLQILIGRLIVLGAFVVLNVIAAVVPILVLLPTLVVLIALPWLVAKGLRFSARVTSYRNVRFDFVGGAGGAFKAFILGGLLAVITLGILTPLASRWVSRYIGSNLRYGGKAFETDPKLGPLYKSWLLSFLIAIIGLGIIALLVVANISLILPMIETPGSLTPGTADPARDQRGHRLYRAVHDDGYCRPVLPRRRAQHRLVGNDLRRQASADERPVAHPLHLDCDQQRDHHAADPRPDAALGGSAHGALYVRAYRHYLHRRCR